MAHVPKTSGNVPICLSGTNNAPNGILTTHNSNFTGIGPLQEPTSNNSEDIIYNAVEEDICDDGLSGHNGPSMVNHGRLRNDTYQKASANTTPSGTINGGPIPIAQSAITICTQAYAISPSLPTTTSGQVLQRLDQENIKRMDWNKNFQAANGAHVGTIQSHASPISLPPHNRIIAPSTLHVTPISQMHKELTPIVQLTPAPRTRNIRNKRTASVIEQDEDDGLYMPPPSIGTHKASRAQTIQKREVPRASARKKILTNKKPAEEQNTARCPVKDIPMEQLKQLLSDDALNFQPIDHYLPNLEPSAEEDFPQPRSGTPPVNAEERRRMYAEYRMATAQISHDLKLKDKVDAEVDLLQERIPQRWKMLHQLQNPTATRPTSSFDRFRKSWGAMVDSLEELDFGTYTEVPGGKAPSI